MNASEPIQDTRSPGLTDDESEVVVLQQLEDERGRLFTESDYQEMRAAVLDEPAHGARMRPFTLFTFAIIALGLAGLALLGFAAIRESQDYTLLIVSSAALIAVSHFFWNLSRTIKNDACRSLDTRLSELGQLRARQLLTDDVFNKLHAHILMSRQRQAVK